MSSLYTTKSLGRVWLPSPVRNGSNRGRYGTLNPPKLRSNSTYEGQLTPGLHTPWKRWSKIHERILLAVIVLVIFWSLGGPMQTRLHHLQENIHFHLPHFSSSSPSTQYDEAEAAALSALNATWSSFAYVTYVTDTANLCSSLQLLESLHRLNSRPARLLLYDGAEFNIDDTNPQNTPAALLRKARDQYGAVLTPVEIIISEGGGGGGTWAASFTKLLAFNQTQYKRVLSLDSDATLLQHMDELFLLPPEVEIAMPKAYWISPSSLTNPGPEQFTSAVVLLTPSRGAFEGILEEIERKRPEQYDMEILNTLYPPTSNTVTVLDHREYILLSGEFRESSHDLFLTPPFPSSYNNRDSNDDEQELVIWNPRHTIQSTKYIHFSDWPLPKPWIGTTQDVTEQVAPKCQNVFVGREGECLERQIWGWLYRDFRDRRKKICGVGMGAEWEVEAAVEEQKTDAAADQSQDENEEIVGAAHAKK